MDRTAEALVDFTARFEYGDLPAASVAAARQRVVDTIGCALAGYSSPPASVARRVAYPVRDDQGARVWGSLTRTTPADAAFANGVAIRYLDFNDTYRSADGTHPSDNVAALLACAEERQASGRAFLAGVAVSYEIQARLADTVPLATMGWDQPTAGVIAAAMGAGKIIGLSREQLAHGLALAIVPNLALHQTRCGELSWWKGCAGAMGARQGLFAAQLAAAGMQGPHDPIEGQNGLWAQIGKSFELKPLGGQAPLWGVQQSNIKTWPVRDSCQIAVDTARALREHVRADQIARLAVWTLQSTYRWAVRDQELWAPQTRETADHSLPFSVAVTLLDGAVTPESFARQRFLDDDILALIGKMQVEISPEFTAQAPAVRNCLIEATLESGERRRAQTVVTKEDIERGLSDAAVEAKFVRLTQGLIADGQRQALLAQLWRLEELDDVARIVDLLRL